MAFRQSKTVQLKPKQSDKHHTWVQVVNLPQHAVVCVCGTTLIVFGVNIEGCGRCIEVY